MGANNWRRAEREATEKLRGEGRRRERERESERRGREEEAAEKLRGEEGRDRFRVFFFSFYTKAGWVGEGQVSAIK